MTDIIKLEPKKSPALAKVRLSGNFQEQTGRWVEGECLLRGFDPVQKDVGIVDIPGEHFPVRVHRLDFEIVG